MPKYSLPTDGDESIKKEEDELVQQEEKEPKEPNTPSIRPIYERPQGQSGSRLSRKSENLGENPFDRIQVNRLETKLRALKKVVKETQAKNSDTQELYKEMTEKILKLD